MTQIGEGSSSVNRMKKKRRPDKDITRLYDRQAQRHQSNGPTMDVEPITPDYVFKSVINLPESWVHKFDRSQNVMNHSKLKVRGALDQVLKYYAKLSIYPTVKSIIDEMGFRHFFQIMDIGKPDRRMIMALIERWWPSTHTFHLPCGELGITPQDFIMLSGISVGGEKIPLPYNDQWTKYHECKSLLPGLKLKDLKSGNIRCSFLKERLDFLLLPANYDPGNDIVCARIFLLYMMGNLFFSNGNSTVQAGYLESLLEIGGKPEYDWGTPILAYLYKSLDLVSILKNGVNNTYFQGFWQLLEYWFYEYGRVGQYLLKNNNLNNYYPRMCGWAKHNRKYGGDELHQVFGTPRNMVEHRRRDNIEWQPWLGSDCLTVHDVHLASQLSFKRVPLQLVPTNQGIQWYLGERCWRQLTGVDGVPVDPPADITNTPIYPVDVMQKMRDDGYLDARAFLVPGVDYTKFWLGVHPISNTIADCTRSENINLIDPQLLNPRVEAPLFIPKVVGPSLTLTYPTQDGQDMGWWFDMTDDDGSRERIPIPHVQFQHPVPNICTVETLYEQNLGLRAAAYNHSKLQVTRHLELQQENERLQRYIQQTADALAMMDLQIETDPKLRITQV